MKVISSTHTLHTLSPEFKDAEVKTPEMEVRHPPGTVVEVSDEEADRLIEMKCVEAYDPMIHDRSPRELEARGTAAVRQAA